MASRAAQLALRQYAEAAGRAAWAQSTADGDSVSAPQTDDVVALGARTLGAGAPPDGAGSAEAAEDDAPQPIQPIQPDGPLMRPPDVRFATARPGDSISRLVGSSDPAVIGRFLSLNGMRPGTSTISSGRNYAIPTTQYDTSPEEDVAGQASLQQDNLRLARLRAQREAADAEMNRESEFFVDGRNVWTGDRVGTGQAQRPRSRSSAPIDDLWARRKAAFGGYAEGLVPGAARGFEHAVEGLLGGAVFAVRAGNPMLDQLLSPPGRTARDEVAGGMINLTQNVDHAVKHLGETASDAADWVGSVNRDYNPFSVPLPSTIGGARQRGEELGRNHGELAFNAGSTLIGGEAGTVLEALPYLSDAGNVAKYVRAGHALDVAEHLAKPYEGMSHHTFGRNRKLPKSLGGKTLPDWILESRFNRLQPRGIDRGQFYKLHFEVDPDFYGTKLPGRRGKGQGFSGRRQGFQKLGPDGQIWNGIPGYTKGFATGAALDLGAGLHALFPEDQPQ